MSTQLLLFWPNLAVDPELPGGQFKRSAPAASLLGRKTTTLADVALSFSNAGRH